MADFFEIIHTYFDTYIQELKISHFFIFIACHCLYFQLNHIHYEATMKILTKIHTFYHNKNLKLFLECGTYLPPGGLFRTADKDRLHSLDDMLSSI